MNAAAPMETGETFFHQLFGIFGVLIWVLAILFAAALCVRIFAFALKTAIHSRKFALRVIIASVFCQADFALFSYGASRWFDFRPNLPVFSLDWFVVNWWLLVGCVSIGVEFAIATQEPLRFDRILRLALKALVSLFVTYWLFYGLQHIPMFLLGWGQGILLALYRMPLWQTSHPLTAIYLIETASTFLMLPFWYARVLVNQGRITRASVLRSISNFNERVAGAWQILVASAVGLCWIAVSVVLAGVVQAVWPWLDALPVWCRGLGALVIVGYPFAKGFAKVINVLRDRAELANEYVHGRAGLASEGAAAKAARGESGR